ncbi:hypothetical protein NDU88_009212 [Pleurodeles waltl]|uniref:Uncharacterized protein n=1 Tax=Pleurodeles waltl TaxID=8319 RepID=A0AAV7QUN6_PLEWA|nr:hypothetical protein NDU88_009212 [Pleurodeles waltl]
MHIAARTEVRRKGVGQYGPCHCLGGGFIAVGTPTEKRTYQSPTVKTAGLCQATEVESWFSETEEVVKTHEELLATLQRLVNQLDASAEDTEGR